MFNLFNIVKKAFETRPAGLYTTLSGNSPKNDATPLSSSLTGEQANKEIKPVNFDFAGKMSENKPEVAHSKPKSAPQEFTHMTQTSATKLPSVVKLSSCRSTGVFDCDGNEYVNGDDVELLGKLGFILAISEYGKLEKTSEVYDQYSYIEKVAGIPKAVVKAIDKGDAFSGEFLKDMGFDVPKGYEMKGDLCCPSEKTEKEEKRTSEKTALSEKQSFEKKAAIDEELYYHGSPVAGLNELSPKKDPRQNLTGLFLHEHPDIAALFSLMPERHKATKIRYNISRDKNLGAISDFEVTVPDKNWLKENGVLYTVKPLKGSVEQDPWESDTSGSKMTELSQKVINEQQTTLKDLLAKGLKINFEKSEPLLKKIQGLLHKKAAAPSYDTPDSRPTVENPYPGIIQDGAVNAAEYMAKGMKNRNVQAALGKGGAPNSGAALLGKAKMWGNIAKAAPAVGVATQASGAVDRYKNKDYVGSAIDGIGALGSAAMLAPHPIAKGVGYGVSSASSAGNAVRDVYRYHNRPVAFHRNDENIKLNAPENNVQIPQQSAANPVEFRNNPNIMGNSVKENPVQIAQPATLAKAGNEALVVSGIHGDEPAGDVAAEKLKDSAHTVSNLNPSGKRRLAGKDPNRHFDKPSNGSMQMRLLELIKKKKPSMVLSLHEDDEVGKPYAYSSETMAARVKKALKDKATASSAHGDKTHKGVITDGKNPPEGSLEKALDKQNIPHATIETPSKSAPLEDRAATHESVVKKLLDKEASRFRESVSIETKTAPSGLKEYIASIGDKKIGNMLVSDIKGKGNMVAHSYLDPKYRGMGLGKKLYGEVMRRQPEGVLHSGPVVSDDALRVWDSLKANKGYAVRGEAPELLGQINSKALNIPNKIKKVLASPTSAEVKRSLLGKIRSLLGVFKKAEASHELEKEASKASRRVMEILRKANPAKRQELIGKLNEANISKHSTRLFREVDDLVLGGKALARAEELKDSLSKINPDKSEANYNLLRRYLTDKNIRKTPSWREEAIKVKNRTLSEYDIADSLRRDRGIKDHGAADIQYRLDGAIAPNKKQILGALRNTGERKLPPSLVAQYPTKQEGLGELLFTPHLAKVDINERKAALAKYLEDTNSIDLIGSDKHLQTKENYETVINKQNIEDPSKKLTARYFIPAKKSAPSAVAPGSLPQSDQGYMYKGGPMRGIRESRNLGKLVDETGCFYTGDPTVAVGYAAGPGEENFLQPAGFRALRRHLSGQRSPKKDHLTAGNLENYFKPVPTVVSNPDFGTKIRLQMQHLANRSGLFQKAAEASHELKSSNIKAVGYDKKEKELEVHFHSGGEYKYKGVPKSIFERIKRAKSPGRFFHKHVKKNNSYEYEKVAGMPDWLRRAIRNNDKSTLSSAGKAGARAKAKNLAAKKSKDELRRMLDMGAEAVPKIIHPPSAYNVQPPLPGI